MAVVLIVLRYSFVLALYIFLMQFFLLLYRDLRPKSYSEFRRAAGCFTVEASPSLIKGKNFFFTAAATIGREKENEIVIPEPTVSQRHARVYLADGVHWLEDLNSTNGTVLNDKPVELPARLKAGDCIKIGGTTLRFN